MVIVLGLAAVLSLAIFGRKMVGWHARREAAAHVAACRIGAAEQCLDRVDRMDTGNGASDILRAACFRHLGQREDWRIAVASARRNGAHAEDVARELMLADLWWNGSDPRSTNSYAALVNAGATPREAATAVVYGWLAGEQPASAAGFIGEWISDTNDEAHASFLRGACRHSSGQLRQAKDAFESAIARQPDHELARLALARVLEEEYDFKEALTHYTVLLSDAPRRRTVRLHLARVLRGLGRAEDARTILESVLSGETTAGLAIEAAEVEYESGNYGAARRWFDLAKLDEAHRAETLRTAASVYALTGNVADAQQLFARVDGAQSQSRQSSEWRRRIALDAGDTVAVNELRRLTVTHPVDRVPSTADSALGEVSPLYLKHCAACHGNNGNGNGRAARHLFPRPSNLRADRLRLISTLNGVATSEDIEEVLRLGVPGTSMPAFEFLSDDERSELIRQVREFRRDGTRDQILASLKDESVMPDANELDRLVAYRITPGEVLAIPQVGAASAQSVDAGRTLYFQSGCYHCHGDRGTGERDVLLLDERGRPTVPRNLVSDPMKGGSSPESLYRRIRLGMPGTAHPAAVSLSAVEVIALVHFCRSLSEEPKQPTTNHQRSVRQARTAFPRSNW